jgi:hypothetical protein
MLVEEMNEQSHILMISSGNSTSSTPTLSINEIASCSETLFQKTFIASCPSGGSRGVFSEVEVDESGEEREEKRKEAVRTHNDKKGGCPENCVVVFGDFLACVILKFFVDIVKPWAFDDGEFKLADEAISDDEGSADDEEGALGKGGEPRVVLFQSCGISRSRDVQLAVTHDTIVELIVFSAEHGVVLMSCKESWSCHFNSLKPDAR